jgi:hypothetical protein
MKRIAQNFQTLFILFGTGLLPKASAGAFEFTDVSTSAGIVHTYDQSPSNFEAIDREFPHFTGGAVAEDFDGDGWVDLFVLRGGLEPNLLYMNQGDGTLPMGPAGTPSTTVQTAVLLGTRLPAGETIPEFSPTFWAKSHLVKPTPSLSWWAARQTARDLRASRSTCSPTALP